MQVLDHDSFLERLASLFESSKDKGSVWLTHKRLTHDGEDATMKKTDADHHQEYPCLIRVTDGKEIKFSTKVSSNDLHRFHTAYSALLKSSLTTTLRKRDKKREKERAEKVARRKRRMSEPVVISGPKRGNGRKKRQRRIRAAIKQQEAQQKAKEREAEKVKKGSS